MGLRSYLRGLGLGIIVTALLMGYTLGNRKEALSDSEIKSRAADLGMVEEDKLLIKPSQNTEDAEKTASLDKDEPAGTIAIEKDEETAFNDGEAEDEALTGAVSEGAPIEAENKDNAVTEADTGDIKDDGQAGTDGAIENNEAESLGGLEEGRNGESTHELNVSGRIDTGDTEPAAETDNKTADADGSEDKAAASADSKSGSETTGRSQAGTAQIRIGGGDDSLDVAQRMEKAGLIKDAQEFDGYLIGRKLDRYISSGSFDIPKNASYQEIAKIITGK